MKSTKFSMKQNMSLATQDEKTVEVLYQKMGDRWFAFSLIDDEVFVGSISQNEIDENQEGICINPEDSFQEKPKGMDRSA